MDWDLVLCCQQVDFGEDETTEKQVGVVMEMSDGVEVGDGRDLRAV
jgi:hypothetical protein